MIIAIGPDGSGVLKGTGTIYPYKLRFDVVRVLCCLL